MLNKKKKQKILIICSDDKWCTESYTPWVLFNNLIYSVSFWRDFKTYNIMTGIEDDYREMPSRFHRYKFAESIYGLKTWLEEENNRKILILKIKKFRGIKC